MKFFILKYDKKYYLGDVLVPSPQIGMKDAANREISNKRKAS